MKLEFFSADCRLCEQTLKLLARAYPGLELTTHRAAECRDGSCCELAAQYGVRAVPTLVLDGEVVMVGVPDDATLRALSARLGRDSQLLPRVS
jgi:glutaredoxin